ncbi:MAG: helix-turn-helix transcriptional regulator [Pseudobdellovibrionaceae bacterium]
MGESEVKSIALFFFFAFLDDRRALDASTQALSLYSTKKKKNPQFNNHVLIVTSTFAVWARHHLKLNRGNPNISTDAGWMIPPDLDIGPWREFQKSATQDELLTVIWSKILEIPEGSIAQGLGISEGTVRYRLGRALRKLGAMSQGVSIKKLNAVK